MLRRKVLTLMIGADTLPANAPVAHARDMWN